MLGSIVFGLVIVATGLGWYAVGRWFYTDDRIRGNAVKRWSIERHFSRKLKRGTVTKEQWISDAEVDIRARVRGGQPGITVGLILFGIFIMVSSIVHGG